MKDISRASLREKEKVKSETTCNLKLQTLKPITYNK
jgi:hypothetical protein